MPKILKTKRYKNHNRKSTKPIVEQFLCTLKGLFAFIICTILISIAIYKGNEFSLFWKILIYASVFTGGLYCGFSSYKTSREKGFINGIISSLIYSLILCIVITVLMKFKISALLLLILPIGLIGGIIGRIISSNIK